MPLLQSLARSRWFAPVLVSLTIGVLVPARAQVPETTTATPHVAAPGTACTIGESVALQIPGPGTGLTEMDGAQRQSLAQLMPPATRLLLAYALPADLPAFAAGEHPLSRYATVHTLRDREQEALGAAEFRGMIEELKQQLGGNDFDTLVHQNLDAIDLGEIQVGTVQSAGTLFERENGLAFALITPMDNGGTKVIAVTGCAILRLKERIVYLSMNEPYTGPESIVALRDALSVWAARATDANTNAESR